MRGTVESLLRWSVPLMISGPGGDSFRPEWLALSVPALLAPRVKVRNRATIGLATGGALLHLRATRAGFEVGAPDGGKLDATLRADAACILGLAAGAITLDEAQQLELVTIEGNESDVRTVLGA